jgi:hypothetical protein
MVDEMYKYKVKFTLSVDTFVESEKELTDDEAANLAQDEKLDSGPLHQPSMFITSSEVFTGVSFNPDEYEE